MYLPSSLSQLYCSVSVFSLTIFASLVTEGYQNLTTSFHLRCVLNDNGAACCYGITVGVLSFLQCILFLGFDVYDATVNSHKFKYAILVLDVTFSIVWTCLWFVGFCFLANQWNRSTHSYLLGSSAARASITFALLSIPCWVSQSSSPLFISEQGEPLLSCTGRLKLSYNKLAPYCLIAQFRVCAIAVAAKSTHGSKMDFHISYRE
uniref:Synaptogyrin 4 n=1 Tax=Varanus komodoensis TaxID=61221 RepID=A0A8D2L9H4_VARKO